MRCVARALEQNHLTARVLGEGDPACHGADRIVLTVNDQHRAADALRQLPCLVRLQAPVGENERLARRLEAPADGVLDRFRRVGLGEDLRHEELEKALVVAEPVVLVVFRPALVGVELVLPGVHRSLGQRLSAAGVARADEDGRLDPLGMVCGEQEASLSAHGEADDDRAIGLGRVHHGDRVRCELALCVRLPLRRAVRATVPAAVESDHAAVPREVRDLHLPVARMNDRPRRQEQHRRLARAVDLVVEAARRRARRSPTRRGSAHASARAPAPAARRSLLVFQPPVDPLEQLAGARSRCRPAAPR